MRKICGKKDWRKLGLWWFCFFFLWLAFSLAAAAYLDPDFGWHFRTGEWIWDHWAVPRKDLFSYTMPDYPWRDHSWLTELIIYKLYPSIGYSGMAFISGIIGASTFILFVPKRLINFAFVPLILAGLASLVSMGVRPKMASLFLAAVVFWILRKSWQKPRWLLILPFLFLIWANLHGGFLIGLGVLFLSILSDVYLIIKGKKNLTKHFRFASFSLFLSAAAILINPYGWRVYQETFLTIFSRELHSKIAEWLPYHALDLNMVFYTGTFLALVYLFGYRLSLFERITSLWLFLAGFLSQRLLVYFFIFSLPLTTLLFRETYSLVFKKKRFKKLWRWRAWFLSAFLVFICLSLFCRLESLKRMSEESFYPLKAVAFLQKEGIAGNLFSGYNWGGYLIGKLPEKKVFADGRMAIWRKNGYSAFEEQEKIISGEMDFEPVFEKYAVSSVLLPVEKESQKSLSVRLLAKFFGKKKTVSSLKERLLESGWQVVYEDETARIFKKT